MTGWVAFDRDLRAEQATLDAMTETMACRGPDDVGTWLGEHAALGHRRLAVIDLAGGRQPMVADTADGPVVLVYCGEVYNFVELRDELTTLGHRFTTRSDTEVVLRGYLQWGQQLAPRLNGMYAFAVWDARDRRLVLARDRLGIKPLYYHLTADGVLFGSEFKALRANPLVESKVGIDGLRELLGYTKNPGQAVWSGVCELAAGTIAVVDADGIRTHRYWSLESRPHPHDRAESAAHVRELLEDIVARQLVADVPRCVLLSGGLDSSTLTALAAGQLAERHETIRSFAIDFAGHAEHFVAARPQMDLDAPYAHEVAAKSRTDHTDIVFEYPELADPELRAAVVTARDLPSSGGDRDISLYLLFQAIRQHSTVALSGESADEVFGGYTQFLDPVAQQADTFPWLAHFARQVDEELGLFTDDFIAALDFDAFIRDSYQTAVAEIQPLPGETDFDYRMRRISYLHITRFVRGLLDRKDRISMAVGLEVRVPYCDHRLVEYVYNTPWAIKSDDGREKSLLRNAAADLLPGSVLRRVKSGYPATQHPAYLALIQQQAKELLTEPGHPVFALVRHDWLRKVAEVRSLQQQPYSARIGLERILELAQWLDIYRPTITFT